MKYLPRRGEPLEPPVVWRLRAELDAVRVTTPAAPPAPSLAGRVAYRGVLVLTIVAALAAASAAAAVQSPVSVRLVGAAGHSLGLAPTTRTPAAGKAPSREEGTAGGSTQSGRDAEPPARPSSGGGAGPD